MKTRKINLLLFSLFLVFLIALPPLFKDQFLSNAQRPWQLLPFGADSLSDFYKKKFAIIEDSPLWARLADTAKPTVMVMVDGWGAPYDEQALSKDFGFFADNAAQYILHKRMFDITTFAENEELSKGFPDGLFVFGGDSSACEKKQKSLKRYFAQVECCINCGDARIFTALDSLIQGHSWSRIALTTSQTSEGNRDSLHLCLRELAKIARKHLNYQFVIQGTHRPILGTPETRRKYLGPWVPAVLVNGNIRIVK